jgi:hypothetical protein
MFLRLNDPGSGALKKQYFYLHNTLNGLHLQPEKIQAAGTNPLAVIKA